MKSDQKLQGDILTAQEVSAYLRLPLTTVYVMTSKGELPGVKCGRQWRYIRQDILNYLPQKRPVSCPFVERRRFPRLKTALSAKVTGLLPETSDREWTGVIHNLSEGGLLISCHGSKLEAGDPVRITFVLPGLNSFDATMILDGRVVYQYAASKFGMKFKYPSSNSREIIRHYVG